MTLLDALAQIQTASEDDGLYVERPVSIRSRAVVLEAQRGRLPVSSEGLPLTMSVRDARPVLDGLRTMLTKNGMPPTAEQLCERFAKYLMTGK